jgi:hypothetical protein
MAHTGSRADPIENIDQEAPVVRASHTVDDDNCSS